MPHSVAKDEYDNDNNEYESYPEEGIGPCPVIIEVFNHQLVVVQRPKLTACLSIIIITITMILVMMIVMITTIRIFVNTISYFYIHIFEAFLFARLKVVRSIYFTHISIVFKFAFNVHFICRVLTAWAKV